jgi:hypothetical protein
MAGDLDEHGFVAGLRERVADSAGPSTAETYEQAMPPGQSFSGLARYLRSRERRD